MNVITRGVRNAFRNAVRTFSIVIILALSIGLALTMLIARQAVQAKIDSVKSSIGNTITISPAGVRGFEGGGEPLTETELAKIKGVAHVISVTSTLQDRLTTTTTNLVSAIEAGTLGRRNNQNSGSASDPGNGIAPPADAPTGASTGRASFTPPVTVVGTSTTTGSVLNGGGSIKITDGKAFDATKDADVALIGTTLAAKNSLKTGSTFQAYGATITVAGIYDSGNTFSNNTVVMPLSTVQRLSNQAGQISSATVQVDSISNIDATTTAIKSTLGSSTADVTSQQDTSTNALAPLENIKNISLYSLVGAVVAGAVIILLTMMMIVRERRREIGVLKAIGASNLKVMFQFMTEAVTFTLLAAVVGLGIGIAAGGPITKLLVTTSSSQGGAGGPMRGGFGRAAEFGGQGLRNVRDVQTAVGWDILLYGLGAAILIAILGSAIPSLLIAKIRPAEVMRAE